MDDKTYCAEIVPCSFDYLMISTLCYLRISCYLSGEHDRVCYGGIGPPAGIGGAYNSRHAYQQLDMLRVNLVELDEFS